MWPQVWPLVTEESRSADADTDNHKNEALTAMPAIQNNDLSSWIHLVWWEKLGRSVTSVFKEASRGCFLTLTSCVAKTQSFKWKHTFFQFLLVAAPGKIILSVTDFQDQKREAGQKWFWDSFWNRIVSVLLSSPHTAALTKMRFGSCFWGGPNGEPPLLTKDTPPSSHSATLRSGSSTLRLSHSSSQAGRKSRSYFNGGKTRLLRQLSTVKILHRKKTHRTQKSDIVYAFSTLPPPSNNKTHRENKKATPKRTL